MRDSKPVPKVAHRKGVGPMRGIGDGPRRRIKVSIGDLPDRRGVSVLIKNIQTCEVWNYDESLSVACQERSHF